MFHAAECHVSSSSIQFWVWNEDSSMNTMSLLRSQQMVLHADCA